MPSGRQWREAALALREFAEDFEARAQAAEDDVSVICGVVCECGPEGEPLACGYPFGHEGAHAWTSLPTWTRGAPNA